MIQDSRVAGIPPGMVWVSRVAGPPLPPGHGMGPMVPGCRGAWGPWARWGCQAPPPGEPLGPILDHPGTMVDHLLLGTFLSRRYACKIFKKNCASAVVVARVAHHACNYRVLTSLSCTIWTASMSVRTVYNPCRPTVKAPRTCGYSYGSPQL